MATKLHRGSIGRLSRILYELNTSSEGYCCFGISNHVPLWCRESTRFGSRILYPFSDSRPIQHATKDKEHQLITDTDTLASLADFVQEIYLKELKAYKPTPIKESDSVGNVQTFSTPATPKSPEESDLASSLQEYESLAVDIEGQDSSATAQTPVAPDWLEAEEDEAAH